jgi:transposase-like protein
MTPADVEHLCRWYRNGATIEGLVEVTPFSYRAIRTALLKAGVTLRPPMIQVPQRPPGMVSAYEHGASIRQLAARFGHSYSQTRNMLLHAGVTLRRQGAPDLSPTWTGEQLRQAGAVMPEHWRGVKRQLDVAGMVRQYKSGMTVREIAVAHDSTYSTVYRRLQAEGVTMRPRGRTFGKDSL